MTATPGLQARSIAVQPRIPRWQVTRYLNRAAAATMVASILLHTTTGMLQVTTNPYMAFIDAVMIIGCSMCLWHMLHSPGPRTWLMGISIGVVMLTQHAVTSHGTAKHQTAQASHHGTVAGPSGLSVPVEAMDVLHMLLLLAIGIGLALHAALVTIHVIRKRR